MNFEYYFARRITFRHQRSVSGLVVRLAIISIALAVAVMEIALSFVQGFETEIQNKVIGFGAHIQIGNYLADFDSEISPLPRDADFLPALDSIPEIVSISPYITRWGMFQTKTGMDGVMLKGVDAQYDWRFFQHALLEGRLPDFSGDKESREILISRKHSLLFNLAVGDKAKVYFFQDTPKRRPVEVVGIYETGMEEFDAIVMICDLRMLQIIMRIDGEPWTENDVMGFEINLRSLSDLEKATAEINDVLPFTNEAVPITARYREIFDWLHLQHQNVWFILILMVIIAIINMSSVVLILIIERTRTIGILKALGLSGFRTQKVFIWNAAFLIIAGMLAGNLLGLGLLASQDAFGWLKVDQENYFITTVPVAWVWMRFLMVNIGVVLACTFFMFIPTLVINRITPVRAIRFQ